jgi:proton-dependent oligopeptide transporter, POT family
MESHRHPAGLYPLSLTEMWERFNFYLMIGILPLYLTDSQKGGMGWTDLQMAVLVGSYNGLVYFTPFIGGLIADRLLGCRLTIVIGGLLMMLGMFVLAVPGVLTLYLGLGLMILGNGAFKPNISTLVGNLYAPGSPLRDAGYNIYYMGINIGAFICNLVAAVVRNVVDEHPIRITSDLVIRGWNAAFATGGMGMLLGLLLFLIYYRRLARADTDPTASGQRESMQPLWLQCLIPAAFLAVAGWFLPDYVDIGLNKPAAAFLGACLPAILFYINIWRGVPDPDDRGRVAALLVIFGIVIVFWMTFMLNTTALNVWARDNTTREPNALVQLITDQMPEFAENAPPSYFDNAGPQVPRPDHNTYEVVSEDKYEELKKAHQLNVIEGAKVYVTQAMLDKIYAHAAPSTPLLPEGKHLKLVNTEIFQSIEPGFIILFTPLIIAFWSYLRLIGREPSTSAKIGLGLLITAGAALTMLGATLVSNDGQTKASPHWLIVNYAIAAVGELCLSPMGLSLVNKMSPANIRAFMMGGWFLSTSFGMKLSGIFGEAYNAMDHRQFWIILIVCNVVCAGVVFLLLPWLNRQMAGTRPST